MPGSSSSWRRLLAVFSLLIGAGVMLWKMRLAMEDREHSEKLVLQRFFHNQNNGESASKAIRQLLLRGSAQMVQTNPWQHEEDTHLK